MVMSIDARDNNRTAWARGLAIQEAAMRVVNYQMRGKWSTSDNMDAWTLAGEGSVLDAARDEWIECADGARLSVGGDLSDANRSPVAHIAGLIGETIQSLGGHARAKSMSKRERSSSARKAARARWDKSKR